MTTITTMAQPFKRQLLEGVPTSAHVTLDFDVNNVESSDTVDIMYLGAHAGKVVVFTSFIVEIMTADGESATANFGVKPTTGSGFSLDADGLDASVDLNASAGTITAGAFGTDAQMGKKLALSGGATVYMTPSSALEDGIIRVTMVYSVFNSDTDYAV